MVNRRKAQQLEESNKKAMAIINGVKSISSRPFTQINSEIEAEYQIKSDNILKGGSNLSAYGGSGGVIDCEVYWNNKLPEDAFTIERN